MKGLCLLEEFVKYEYSEVRHVSKYLGSEVNLSLCMFFRSKIPQDSASSRTLPCLNC